VVVPPERGALSIRNVSERVNDNETAGVVN
jgi:hypothetical protein